MTIFSGKDIKTIRAPSNKFHLRYLLGMPDEFEGHEGDILIVSPDDPYQMVFANITPSGVVVTEKVRIDGLEPAGYLGQLVDDDTIVVIGDTNNKRIAVSDQFLKRIGGHITGDITMEPGTTIDGIDISELYNYFLDKNTSLPQSITGPIVFNGYVTFAGGTNISGTGGTGVNQFTLLTDTPSDYTGQAGKFLKVNDSATALEFVNEPDGTGSSTTDELTDLTDTPSDYTGKGNHAIQVKNSENGIEFIDVNISELSSSTSELENDLIGLTNELQELSSSTSDSVNNLISVTGELSSSTDDIELDIDNIYDILDNLSSSTSESEENGTRITEEFDLSPTDISSKYVQLSYAPIDYESSTIKIKGGATSIYGIDYTINDRLLSWNGYDLDGILLVGDKLFITYWY